MHKNALKRDADFISNITAFTALQKVTSKELTMTSEHEYRLLCTDRTGQLH